MGAISGQEGANEGLIVLACHDAWNKMCFGRLSTAGIYAIFSEANELSRRNLYEPLSTPQPCDHAIRVVDE